MFFGPHGTFFRWVRVILTITAIAAILIAVTSAWGAW